MYLYTIVVARFHSCKKARYHGPAVIVVYPVKISSLVATEWYLNKIPRSGAWYLSQIPHCGPDSTVQLLDTTDVFISSNN